MKMEDRRENVSGERVRELVIETILLYNDHTWTDTMITTETPLGSQIRYAT